MNYIISIFVLSLLGCSSTPSSIEKPTKLVQGKATYQKPKPVKATRVFFGAIEPTKMAAKKEDFCYYKKNKTNKRCRYTLLSSEAENTYYIRKKNLKDQAKKLCRDGQSIKIPRNEKKYMALRSQEDAIARVANLAVKKGANTIYLNEVKPKYVAAEVYDCTKKIIDQLMEIK